MKGHRFLVMLLLLTTLIPGLQAQNQSPKGNPGEGFKEFRERMLSDFHSFKQRILDQYADFLEGTWHPYEPLVQEGRDSVPKPVDIPRLNDTPAPSGNSIPEREKPVPAPDPVVYPPQKPSAPAPAPFDRDIATEEFDFYGIPVSVPAIEFSIVSSLKSDASRGEQFRTLRKSHARLAAQSLAQVATAYGLNDYLTLRLAEAYLKHKFPYADEGSRFSALHYLLSEMGYEVRLGYGNRNIPVLLVPFNQKVSWSIYLQFDGKNYTAVLPDGMDVMKCDIGMINTCDLPSDREMGRQMDLRVGPLNLPRKDRSFDISFGKVHLQGVTNENMFRMLYNYPIMPMEDFAASSPDPELRRLIVDQIRSQLGSLPPEEAVNALLAFFHFAFDYATDTQNHGREKPYFIEETLYYDKNDCEDRAIMFSWLVWNALGLPAHLNYYPGHESAAVALESVGHPVYSYTYNGKTYFNADPTFQGSHVGEVMKQFTSTKPKIEKTYPE